MQLNLESFRLRLLKHACKYLSQEDAQDAVQETLICAHLKAQKTPPHFESDRMALYWLTAILTNKIGDAIRKAQRDTDNLNCCGLRLLPDYNDLRDTCAEEVLERAETAELRGRLYSLLEQDRATHNNPKHDRVLEMYLDDCNYREIAEATGLSEVNGRQIVFLTKQRLRQLIDSGADEK